MLDRESVLQLVRSSLQKLFEKDDYLLKHYAREHTLAFKLAWHMLEQLPEFLKKTPLPAGLSQWPEYTVDVEFSIDRGKTPKESLLAGPEVVIPDVILHERGTKLSPQIANLLAIEIKRIGVERLDKTVIVGTKCHVIGYVGLPLLYQHALYLAIHTDPQVPRLEEARLISRNDYARLGSPRPIDFRDAMQESYERENVVASHPREQEGIVPYDPETRVQVRAREAEKRQEIHNQYGLESVTDDLQPT